MVVWLMRVMVVEPRKDRELGCWSSRQAVLADDQLTVLEIERSVVVAVALMSRWQRVCGLFRHC